MIILAKFSVSLILGPILTLAESSTSAESFPLMVVALGLLVHLTMTLCQSSTPMMVSHAVAVAVVSAIGSGAPIACTASRV